MIMNLTQHPATQEQRDAGVIDLCSADQQRLRELLTIPVSGDNGVAENLGAAPEFLEAHAAEIMREFIVPRVFANAESFLGDDEVSGFDAFCMLRPEIAADGLKAMVGGAPYLVERLVRQLREFGVTPLYALSDRVSVDGPDGKKTSVFKHCGFIEAA